MLHENRWFSTFETNLVQCAMIVTHHRQKATLQTSSGLSSIKALTHSGRMSDAYHNIKPLAMWFVCTLPEKL